VIKLIEINVFMVETVLFSNCQDKSRLICGFFCAELAANVQGYAQCGIQSAHLSSYYKD